MTNCELEESKLNIRAPLVESEVGELIVLTMEYRRPDLMNDDE